MAKERSERVFFMFTGLIELVGRVNCRAKGLAVTNCQDFAPLTLGESIAVDGVCLTVAGLIGEGFFADVSEETLLRTTLGEKAERGAAVNLERALRLSDRLGGHLVTGHVDGLGEVISIKENESSWLLEIAWREPGFGKYICEKGSISVDGVSLTVGGCSEKGTNFWIAVIPHTWINTSFRHLKTGSLVNLEADLIAKYAESILTNNESNTYQDSVGLPQNVSKSWLAEHGWT